MIKIETSHIQLFIMIPMLISEDFYRILDPDELVDQQYLERMLAEDKKLGVHPIPELRQPLFITDDFKAVFRPMALEMPHVNSEQAVQTVLPSLNIVAQLKWGFELMCNLGLLVFEIEAPSFTSLGQINDLLETAQLDAFAWNDDNRWILPHRSITQMLELPANEAVSLAQMVGAFGNRLHATPIIKAQHPFVSFLLQMNIAGGDDFYRATNDLGEYLLAQRYRHLASALCYYENQKAFIGTNWRYAQNLDTSAWFEWQPPKLRDLPLTQHRHAASNIFTTSLDRRRAARRVCKICTLEYITARLMAHLLASHGEAHRLRLAIQEIARKKERSNASYYDIMLKLSRLEARYILLNTNITNPDWVLENPFGEGTNFIKLMYYIDEAYGIRAHLQALRQHLDLLNQMLDRTK